MTFKFKIRWVLLVIGLLVFTDATIKTNFKDYQHLRPAQILINIGDLIASVTYKIGYYLSLTLDIFTHLKKIFKFVKRIIIHLYNFLDYYLSGIWRWIWRYACKILRWIWRQSRNYLESLMCISTGLVYLIVNPCFEFMQGIWVYVFSVYHITEFFA